MNTPRRVASLVVAAGLLAALPLPGRADPDVVRTCEPFATVAVADGRFIVQQNEWNSTLTQCMRVEGTAWRITRASFDLSTDGPPATYPSVFSGCHWGTCTLRGPLPIAVEELGRMRATWSTELPETGAFNVTFDVWTNSSPSTTGQPDGSEIMIWLTSRGGVQPAGSVVDRVRIGDAAWDVWTTRMASWNYVAYVRRRGARSVEDLNLRAFVRDSVDRGATAASWHVIAVEAGFEVWQGGEGLATAAFRFRAGSMEAAHRAIRGSGCSLR
jgi:Glycosyl hydrolase family 12